MSATTRLVELGIELPPPPQPVGSYLPGIRVGDLIFVSGQIPITDGAVTTAGKVGADVSLEQGLAAARQCALAGLSIASNLAGGIDRIRRIIRIAVFVNSAPGFTDQPKVANGASDVMAEIFGENGRHVRAAVGVSELPLNAAVEVELVAESAN